MITTSPYPQSLRIKIECTSSEEYIQFSEYISKFKFKKQTDLAHLAQIRNFERVHKIGERTTHCLICKALAPITVRETIISSYKIKIKRCSRCHSQWPEVVD